MQHALEEAFGDFALAGHADKSEVAIALGRDGCEPRVILRLTEQLSLRRPPLSPHPHAPHIEGRERQGHRPARASAKTSEPSRESQTNWAGPRADRRTHRSPSRRA